MVKPVRLQRSRRKGSKLTSPNGLPIVCVTRGTKWGNPFRIGVNGWTDGQCATTFKDWIEHSREGQSLLQEAKRELRGKNLACWCAPDKPCHADVLLELVNVPAPDAREGERR